MEEHFNENYMESYKFPKATFKGIIVDIYKVKFIADGNYPVIINGDLTIHGVTNKTSAKGEIIVKNGAISGQSTFSIALVDYKITVPAIARSSIAKTIAITVSCLYNQKL